MNKLIQSFMIFGFLVFPNWGWAQTITRIAVSQKADELTFAVTLQNTDSKSALYQLTAKSLVISSEDVKLSKDALENHVLEIAPGQTGSIHYRLQIDLEQLYFLADANVWHPIRLQPNENDQFFIQSKLEKSFQLIHSATNQNQDSVAYVFGKFTKYSSTDSRIQIFLKQDDPNLAQTLIDNLNAYLKTFEANYGLYPYADFSVVESPDEVGLAFPRMTWMGSQLLRFPFILKTSLPHELLHSWWGNGVFVDHEKGNWCEGLTTFGADYALLSENEKKAYRIKAISNYLNYTQGGAELPLSKFVSRGEDRALQALGYDKALMVFVMLEQMVGPEKMRLGLKNFYQDFKFKKASYKDFFETLEELSGYDLTEFYNFWIEKPGLVTQNFVSLKKSASNVTVQAKPFELKKIPNMPLQFSFYGEGANGSKETRVSPDGRRVSPENFSIQPATSYSVDPNFYLFRDLNEVEKPLSFSSLFGTKSAQLFMAESDWAEALQAQFPDMALIQDGRPLDFALKQTYVLSLGEALKNSKINRALLEKNVKLQGDALIVDGKTFSIRSEAVFFSVRVENSKVFIIHLNTQLPAARWIQRWSHYGGQSYTILNAKSASGQGTWYDTFKIHF